MHRPFVAAALLIASLAACDADNTEQPATESTEAATESAAIPDTIPEPADAEAAAALNSSEAEDSGCGADKLGRWLNVLPTDDVKASISQAVGERPIRYYTQGDPITMDFSPARLNVELGEDGRIKLFRCG
jgi:3-oxoacyl-ACP reductase-like protein